MIFDSMFRTPKSHVINDSHSSGDPWVVKVAINKQRVVCISLSGASPIRRTSRAPLSLAMRGFPAGGNDDWMRTKDRSIEAVDDPLGFRRWRK